MRVCVCVCVCVVRAHTCMFVFEIFKGVKIHVIPLQNPKMIQEINAPDTKKTGGSWKRKDDR